MIKLGFKVDTRHWLKGERKEKTARGTTPLTHPGLAWMIPKASRPNPDQNHQSGERICNGDGEMKLNCVSEKETTKPQ